MGHPGPRVSAQHTPAAVDDVGERRLDVVVMANSVDGSATTGDPAPWTRRCSLRSAPVPGRVRRVMAHGWPKSRAKLPPRGSRYVERLGGWRLDPRVVVDQLAALRTPAPLIWCRGRQMGQASTRQLEFLGEAAEIVVHPAARPRQALPTTGGARQNR